MHRFLLLIFIQVIIIRASGQSGDYIPQAFKYPKQLIGNGKVFIYQNQETKQKTFVRLNNFQENGMDYQTIVRYDSTGTNDSVKIFNDRMVEAFNFFINKGGPPIRANSIQDTIITTGQKLGLRRTELQFLLDNGLSNKFTSREEYLKDTTIVWEESELPCLVTRKNTQIEIEQMIDTVQTATLKIASKFFYAKGIGVIKYSIHFVAHGEAVDGSWELIAIKDMTSGDAK